jgi:hypothetical protein
MKNVSNSVLIQKPNYSLHDLTQETKTTTTMGRLTPVFFQEVVPGDSITIRPEMLLKFMPLQYPVLHNMTAYIHYFYVPFRILWRNWKYYIANAVIPGTSNKPIHPYLLDTGIDGLSSYFGVPQDGVTEFAKVNPFLYATYQLIYNEYYRHQSVHPDQREKLWLTDGDNSNIHSLLTTPRIRTYKDDYFTSALPSPQQGTEAKLDIFDFPDLPVKVNRDPNVFGPIENWLDTNGNPVGAFNDLTNQTNIPQDTIYADGANGAVSMNDLIELNRLNEYLIRNNISGNRYNEFIMAHFGERVPDLRVDRPDYIVGVKTPVQVSELLNTANNQGFQSGQANAYAQGNSNNYQVTEHGIIMGIFTMIPSIGYTSATPKLLHKLDRFDYFLPVFDAMGEQEIKNKELVANHTNPEGTFGYVPRYSEYRLPFNLSTGQLATTLKQMHLNRDLPNNTNLNASFFDANPINRIFVNTSNTDNLILQVMNNVIVNRPMTKYSMPVITNQADNKTF